VNYRISELVRCFWLSRGRHWTEPICELYTSTCVTCVSYCQLVTRTPTTQTSSTKKRSCVPWTSRQWRSTIRQASCSPLTPENQVYCVALRCAIIREISNYSRPILAMLGRHKRSVILFVDWDVINSTKHSSLINKIRKVQSTKDRKTWVN